MKIFPQLQLALDQRAQSKIKFQGFAQGISYGSGEVTLGNYTFKAGVDFDVSQNDAIAISTLRDAIVNKTVEFWADGDYDTNFLYIYCKEPGTAGNNWQLSSTLDPQALIPYYGHLMDGLDVYHSDVYDFSCIEKPSKLELSLNCTLINGGDSSSQVCVVIQQAIDDGRYPSNVFWHEGKKQFKAIGFDPVNFNLINNKQILTITNSKFMGNKLRFKILQTGKNSSAELYLNILAK